MERSRFYRRPLFLWVAVAVGIVVLVSWALSGSPSYTQATTSDVLSVINTNPGNIEKATIEDKEQTVNLDLASKVKLADGTQSDKIQAQFPALSIDSVYGLLTTADQNHQLHANATVDTKVSKSSLLLSVLVNFLPIAAIVVLLLFFMSQAQGGGSRVLNFGKSKAKLISKDTPKTTFADVAGSAEAVEELQEIKDFLQNPAKYQALGAKIPKGVLLFGPPGTGKTLLARAVAGEAGVPFYTISGSDFVEMFVGVGASRVRDLFQQAKENAPAIVFVDEIDAVGRHRGAGLGGGHDEREQTLNQLLVEMDGFDTKGGVILIAATNRPDILDPALLRPGRFDRQIAVDTPDMEGRKAILRVHAKGKPFQPDVDLDAVARRTPGLHGCRSGQRDQRGGSADRTEREAGDHERVPRGIDRPCRRRSGPPDPGHERSREEDHRVPRGWSRTRRVGVAALGAGAQGDDPVAGPISRPHARAADRGQVHADAGRAHRHVGVRTRWSRGGGARLPRADHRRRQRHREGDRDRARDDHRVRHECEARRGEVRPERRRAVPRPDDGPPARLLGTGLGRDRCARSAG